MFTLPQTGRFLRSDPASQQPDSAPRGMSRVVIKFGEDIESAQTLNRLLHQHFDEEQIYIDHFSVRNCQNLLHSANTLIEPYGTVISSITQITVAESIGIEGRRYYDAQVRCVICCKTTLWLLASLRWITRAGSRCAT